MNDEFNEANIRALAAGKKIVAAVRLAAAGRTLAMAADQFNELSTLMTTPEDVLEELGQGTAQAKREEKRLMAKGAYVLARDAALIALKDVAEVLGS